MYEAYFGLKENPFSIAPDPRYLYMSEKHQEALAHLMFSLSGGNRFVLLTGEVGTGKTTLCRGLLGQLPEDVDVALILNPRFNAVDLLAAVCDELGIRYPKDGLKSKTLNDLLVRHLLDVRRKGRRTFLIIDEAQNLGVEVLEEVRLLTNLETSEEKLLQIILIGQPELRGLLARDELRQLSQRITARYHLDTLTRAETTAYIEHRLAVAGCPRALFNGAAIAEVHKQSKGTPRLINTICDRSLLGAYAEGKGKVDRRTVRTAADEVLGEAGAAVEESSPGLMRRWVLPVLLIVVLLAAGGWYYLKGDLPALEALPAVAVPEPPPLPEESVPEPEVAEIEPRAPMNPEPVLPESVPPESESTGPMDAVAASLPAIPAPEVAEVTLVEDGQEAEPESVDEPKVTENESPAPVAEEGDTEADKPVLTSVESPDVDSSEPTSSEADADVTVKREGAEQTGRPLTLKLDMHTSKEAAQDLGFDPNSSSLEDAADASGDGGS